MGGTLTPTQAACHIPELWSRKTRDAVEAEVVAAGLVDQSYTSELKGGPGDTMNIPYISNLTANTKTANSNITLEVVGPSSAEASQSFTSTTHQHAAVAEETITKVQSQTALLEKYAKKAGYALAAAADTNLHTLPQNFSQVVGTLGVDPSWDNFLRCQQYLDDANAPMGDRFVILRPASYYAMRKVENFINADYKESGGVSYGWDKARRGTIDKVPIYVTTLVRAPSAGQAENWFCHSLGVYYCSQHMYTNRDYIFERDAKGFLAGHIYGYAEALQPPITAGGGAATDVFNVLLRGTS